MDSRHVRCDEGETQSSGERDRSRIVRGNLDGGLTRRPAVPRLSELTKEDCDEQYC